MNQEVNRVDKDSRGVDDSKLKYVIYLFLILGVMVVISLINAIINRQSFYSDLTFIFLFYFSYRLHKKNVKTYKTAKKYATYFLIFSTGALIFLLISTYQFLSIKNMKLKYVAESSDYFEILFFIIAIPVIVYLLNHNSTRRLFNILPDNSAPWSLYLKKRTFFIVIFLSFALALLLGWPHFVRNPYKIIVNVTLNNAQITEDVGEINTMSLTYSKIHNWYHYSVWKIEGERAEDKYKIIITPKYDISFEKL